MKQKILIVDDDPDILDVLKICLDDYFDLTLINDSKNVFETIEKNRFDLLVTDLVMPNVSGLELISSVKKKWPKIPIIAFSRLLETDTDFEALGITKYIEKPLNPELFIEEICSLLKVDIQS